MHNSCNSYDTRPRSDLRALDNHESWRGVYALLDVEPSIEPSNNDSDATAISKVNNQ
jgi:hypothetical protein